MTGIVDEKMLWAQFGATLDDFASLLRDCPQELWTKPLWDDQPDQWVAPGFSQYWYLCYHTLFWLDLYLGGSEEGFQPPAPFDLVEMQANETLPRSYTPGELLDYLGHLRQRSRETILTLTPQQANRICRFPWGELPYAELLLYTLRHIQEHSAQLHLFLGQQAGLSARWVSRAKEEPVPPPTLPTEPG
jgi:hypothetical protein